MSEGAISPILKPPPKLTSCPMCTPGLINMVRKMPTEIGLIRNSALDPPESWERKFPANPNPEFKDQVRPNSAHRTIIIPRGNGWNAEVLVFWNFATLPPLPSELCTTAICCVNGYPFWQATYLPFGTEYTPQISVNNYKFTGYEHDSESGLEYANLRHYSSQYARFMSTDPVSGNPGNPQSLNRYTYALDNPLSLFDPRGGQDENPIDDGNNQGEGSMPEDNEGAVGDGGAYGMGDLGGGDTGYTLQVTLGSQSGEIGNISEPTTVQQGDQIFSSDTGAFLDTAFNQTAQQVLGLTAQMSGPTMDLISDGFVAEMVAVTGGMSLLGDAGILGTGISDAASSSDLITVSHFTDLSGAESIADSGEFWGGGRTYVTLPSEVPTGSSPAEIEDLLEIGPGKGQAQFTFQTPARNLGFAENGLQTSGRALQWTLINPQALIP